MKKKMVIVFIIVALSTVATASFITAFAPIKEVAHASHAENEAPDKKEQKDSLAGADDFKAWLASYKGVTGAEKNIAYGMMEQNTSKAAVYFKKACSMGDERGCFQLGLNEIGQGDADGLDKLKMLAIQGKSKDLGLKSARLLGAYILDFAQNNKSAVSQGLEAVLPYAVQGDASSQFLAAHLFAASGNYDEADSMLTKSCTNRDADSNIVEYCESGQNVEVVDANGGVISNITKEQSTCGAKM